jgi:ABC-type Zn uptake system ZnuABC Zn-binding protein ZnuA
MERMFSAFLATFLLLATYTSGANGDPLVVAATLFAPASWLQTLVGTEAQVVVLLPPGANPHTFEPLPAQVRSLREATLLVQIGAGLDEWAAKLTRVAERPIRVWTLAEHVPLLPLDEHEHGRDPHFWLDPILVRDHAVPALVAALSELDPTRAEGFRARGEQLRAELTQLDARLQHLLAPVRGRAYVAVHSAWRYFARRYGLVEAGSVEPIPGREPSAKELIQLVESIRRTGARALVVEPYSFSRTAEQLAAETQLRLVTIDPFGSGALIGGYTRLLEANAHAFVEALQ